MGREPRTKGRTVGGHNRGYWFRSGRGWYATVEGQTPRLLDEHGQPIRDKKAERQAKIAYAKLLTGARERQRDGATVAEIAAKYLEWAKTNNRLNTYLIRKRWVDSFVGLFGTVRVKRLTRQCVDEWFGRSPSWGDTTRRIAFRSVMRAVNWAVDRGTIVSNPLRGYKAGNEKRRTTYFSPEQEKALIEHASPAFALALRVLIRTGCRPGCEFAAVTAGHVHETPNGQVWRFSSDESKTRRPRTVYVPGEIAGIVRDLIKRDALGPLFKNAANEPWNLHCLRNNLKRAVKRAAKTGLVFALGSCVYSCRHTFAKRTLGGFWTGKPATIEQAAGLLGNSRQVCWDYYAQWCAAYSDPLWDALGRDRSAAVS